MEFQYFIEKPLPFQPDTGWKGFFVWGCCVVGDKNMKNKKFSVWKTIVRLLLLCMTSSVLIYIFSNLIQGRVKWCRGFPSEHF